MSIYLPAPAHRPGGPDGKGWSRLSLNAHIGAGTGQCALRPYTYPALVNIRRGSVFAAFGSGYQSCIRQGACDGCPILGRWNKHPRRVLTFGEPRALVRLEERWDERFTVMFERPHVMDRPEGGWAETSVPFSWFDLARLKGWKVGRAMRDEHSAGFWLEALTSRNGLFGDPSWEPLTKAGVR